MKKLHINRLKKLIAFLRKLPAENFDLGVEFRKRPQQKCPTVACAIGWTPSVFPNLVKWTSTEGTFKCGKERMWYANVAHRLFGIPVNVASDLFFPNYQGHVDLKLPNCTSVATPSEVADMLEKYLELQAQPQ